MTDKIENYEFDKSGYIQVTIPTLGGLQSENDKLKQENQKLREALTKISKGKSDGLDHREDVIRLERAINIAKKALQQDLTKE